MSKKRKSNARDRKNATSISRPKVELSLGEKLKAAGIVEEKREDPAARGVDCDSQGRGDNEPKTDKQQTDRDELNRAYLGVKRLGNQRNRRARAPETSIRNDTSGCKPFSERLSGPREFDLLATPGFEIKWDRDGDVTALRRDVEIAELSSLFGSRFKPEATLDLHGTVSKDLEKRVTRFVLDQYRRGVQRLLLVHGKGRHSEDGVGVLADHLAKLLTESRVSYYVRGFCTANLEHGGSGALAVMLIS